MDKKREIHKAYFLDSGNKTQKFIKNEILDKYINTSVTISKFRSRCCLFLFHGLSHEFVWGEEHFFISRGSAPMGSKKHPLGPKKGSIWGQKKPINHRFH